MKKRILVVEDDLAVLKVTKMRLEHAGYEVVTAADGEQAVNQAFSGGSLEYIRVLIFT